MDNDIEIISTVPFQCHYRILVFWCDYTDKGSIKWYVEKWHGHNCVIDYINTDYLLAGLMDSSKLQKLVDNFRWKRYDTIYITSQKKKTRQAIRQMFKELYHIDLHIKTYAKLVLWVKGHSMLK